MDKEYRPKLEQWVKDNLKSISDETIQVIADKIEDDINKQWLKEEQTKQTI